ncbi:MAG: hypothetical protein GY861_09895 [bacterium]|nr:hypothetical protein [bacterium]
MSLERTLIIPGVNNSFYPIVLAGMGANISNLDLAVAVGIAGGVATRSSVALDRITPIRLKAEGRPVNYINEKLGLMDQVEATRIELRDTKEGIEAITGEEAAVALNIMRAVDKDYRKSIEAGARERAMLIVGAGPAMDLPKIVEEILGTKNHDVPLVPKVSSGRALDITIRRWARQKCKPAAVVVEGSKAGGHLGFKYEQIRDSPNFIEEYDIFKIIPEVMGVLYKYELQDVPVIAAGGIFYNFDIDLAFYLGASAVKVGTRFLGGPENGLAEKLKPLVVASEGAFIAEPDYGSPCNYAFAYDENSPLALQEKNSIVKEHMDGSKGYFGICPSLLAAHGIESAEKGCLRYVKPPKDECPAFKTCLAVKGEPFKALVTAGYNVTKIKEDHTRGIVTAPEIMQDLIG